MEQRYIIILTGYSCSGKSTLIKELQKDLPGSYHIGYDKIKWGLAGYDREKDMEIIKILLNGFLEIILNSGIPCITDMLFREKKKYTDICTLATKYGYKIIAIELRCPLDIRLARFHERIERAKQDPHTKISVTDEKIFLENNTKSFYFPEDALVFDTSTEGTTSIAYKILQELR